MIEQGMKSAEVQNFYADGMPTVTVGLDPSLTPPQNAQRYYKKYNKAKTAETEAAKQLKSAREELDYLESTLAALENAETESDLNAVRAELTGEGYLKNSSAKKQKQPVSKPIQRFYYHLWQKQHSKRLSYIKNGQFLRYMVSHKEYSRFAYGD